MTDFVHQADESSVTARLKELLRDISPFIDNASEDQKQRLLSVLEESLPIDRRRDTRKPCSIAVTCATYRVFTDFIKNISPGGAFIETSAPCLPGEHLTMMFSLPDQEEPVKITGKIVWRAPEGVGVKFTTASKDFSGKIESF